MQTERNRNTTKNSKHNFRNQTQATTTSIRTQTTLLEERVFEDIAMKLKRWSYQARRRYFLGTGSRAIDRPLPVLEKLLFHSLYLKLLEPEILHSSHLSLWMLEIVQGPIPPTTLRE